MKLLTLLILLNLSSLSSQKIVLRCFYYFETYFTAFNVKDIQLPVQFKKRFIQRITLQIKWSKCYVDIPSECTNKNIESTSVLFVSDKGDCSVLLSDSKSKNQYNLLDKEDPNKGLTITQENKNFNVQLQCAPDLKDPAYLIDGQQNLVITSNDACGQKNELAEFIHDNKYLYCVILISIGIIFLLLGGYKWDLILTIVGFLVGCGGIWFIFWAFVKFKKNTNSYIIIAIISIIVGILIASLCRTFTNLSYFLLGFIGGFVTMKYILITFQFQGEEWLYNLIIIIAGILVGVFCLVVEKYSLAIVTATLGGLLVTFNFGYMIGALDNLYDIFDRIKSGDNVKPAYYVFFVLFIILTLLGLSYQFKQIYKENKIKKIESNEMLLN